MCNVELPFFNSLYIISNISILKDIKTSYDAYAILYSYHKVNVDIQVFGEVRVHFRSIYTDK